MAAGTASADVGSQQSEFDTLTGECTKVMLMDILTDPAVCSDQVTAIRSGNGTLGYAFTIDFARQSQAMDHIVLGRESEARKSEWWH